MHLFRRTFSRRWGWITLALLFSFGLQAHSAKPRQLQDRIEGIQTQQPAGANQMPLRAVILRGDARVESVDGRLHLSIPVPPTIRTETIDVQVRDNLGIGYYMRPTPPCAQKLPCEFSWPDTTALKAGIQPSNLWGIARSSEGEKLILPVCFCPSADLPSHRSIIFIFVPVRTVNLEYAFYSLDGKLVSSGRRQGHPARLPYEVEFPWKSAGQSFRLVLKHIASSGPSAERFSDTYDFAISSQAQ